MQELKFKIRGITPLLCHNPASMRDQKGFGRKQIPSAEDEAEKSVYRFEDGSFAFPAIGIRSSILTGAKGLRSGRTALTSLINHIMVFPISGNNQELIELKNSKGKSIKEYEIDSRRVVIQGNGIIRSRPKFADWSFEFKIIYDEEVIPNGYEIFKLIIKNAGIKTGLGDYRVSCKGWFGQYELCE